MAESSAELESGWWDNLEKEKSWWHPVAKKLVTSGPIPSHVAFVMDGNRRFAKTHRLGSALQGHMKGFEQLAKILEWCRDFGIHTVTVYAFSIENFKRSKEEVSGLMALAEEKFSKLLEEKDKLEEHQISFRFFGNVGLLSPKLRQLVAKIQLATREYTKGTVNVCMPYTSRDEMARSFELIRKGVQKGLLEEDQIDEWLVSRCLDSGQGSDPDILIRTSGEKRLSDFLLWQCSSSHIYYDEVLWPEFTYWNLCKAILSYQYYHSSIQMMGGSDQSKTPIHRDSLKEFLNWVDQSKLQELQEYASQDI